MKNRVLLAFLLVCFLGVSACGNPDSKARLTEDENEVVTEARGDTTTSKIPAPPTEKAQGKTPENATEKPTEKAAENTTEQTSAAARANPNSQAESIADQKSQPQATFNTLTDTDEWGDEADFLRAVKIKEWMITTHAKNFASKKLGVETRDTFALVGYVHNASAAELSDAAISFSYPDLLRADGDNQVCAALSAANAETITDTLDLKTWDDIILAPADDAEENLAMVVSNLETGDHVPVMLATTNGIITQTVPLPPIQPNEALTVFIIFTATLATSG